MPWQGQKDNIIDRFDARAHLDFIPPLPGASEDSATLSNEERQINYERFRVLAQNEFLGISEEKFLQQLYLEEQYGVNAQQEADRNAAKKAQKPQTGAAIGYTYEDSTGDYPSSSSTGFGRSRAFSPPPPTTAEEESDSDLDVDVSININKLDVSQGNELNKFGNKYGMLSNDFYSFLTRDADEADAMRLAREEEHEKVLLGGRKSRRERRAQRERKFIKRFQSPPSYATKEEDFRDSVSGAAAGAGNSKKKPDEETESRSPSPVNSGEITYITSFGGEDEAPPPTSLAKAKNQTMSRLQQLKSQLTLGSIIGEKRDALAVDRARAAFELSRDRPGPAPTSSTKKQAQATDIVAKPVLYRRRSRSPSHRRPRSRSRHRRDHHRRSSSRSRSRSFSSSSSRDGQRGRQGRDDRNRRYGGTSKRHEGRRRSSSYSNSSSRSSSSSSSSSQSSYLRRKSTNRRNERPSLSPQKPRSRISPKASATKPSLPSELASTRPTVGTAIPTAPKKAPSPPVVVIPLPEIQVPIKKYYGRRKEDLSDSELSYSEDEKPTHTQKTPKTTTIMPEQSRESRTDSNA